MSTDTYIYRPLPNSLTIKESQIEGLGLFAKEFIPKETELGVSHYISGEEINRTPLGGFYNHSEEPNCYSIISEEVDVFVSSFTVKLVTKRDVEEGEELTTHYSLIPWFGDKQPKS
jgi:SET domain-containing protein